MAYFDPELYLLQKKKLDVSLKTLAYIFIAGFFSTLILTFMIYVMIMRIATLTASDLVENDALYLFIIIILEIITIVCSVLVSLVMGNIADEPIPKLVLGASVLCSYLIHLVIVLLLSYTLLFIFYPETMSQIFYSPPSVLAYFSVFVLKSPFGVLLLSIPLYFGCLILCLNYFR